MSGLEPFIGEIRMFAGNFAPAGWMFCQGQTLQISDNENLFSLIGTTYGGDGSTTFKLPDLNGRVPVHQGVVQGQSFTIGQQLGAELASVNAQQMPVHSHAIPASTQSASSRAAVGGVPAGLASDVAWATGVADEVMATSSATGSSEPHENMQPFLGVSFIISLFGVLPTQS